MFRKEKLLPNIDNAEKESSKYRYTKIGINVDDFYWKSEEVSGCMTNIKVKINNK